MEKELYIYDVDADGKVDKTSKTDAYTEYGITLMGDSLSNLQAPPPMKGYVENESRLDHGKHVIIGSPKVDSREVTITLGILGSNSLDFQRKKDKFVAKLQKGTIALQIPDVTSDIYRLIYTKNTQYAFNTSKTFCKMACKFVEADPTQRS